MRHYGNGGIQEHSIGDYYPGGTYIKAGLGPGGTIVAWNLVTGEIYGEVQFEDWGKDYYAAHERADALIPADVPYRKKQPQHVAVVETSTDVASSRRNVMSKYTVPADQRLLSDELIGAINPRRVLGELITFYENVVAKDEQDRVEFEASECADHEECRANFEGRVNINRNVLNGLISFTSEIDQQQQEFQESTGNGGLEQLLSQLGIDPSQFDVVNVNG